MKNQTTGIEAGKGADGALSGEFHNFILDIEDMIKATTSLTGEDLIRAKAALNARVNEAKASVEKMSGEISERARNAAKAADGYVHENPWQVIGVSAALGLVLGYVLSRRS